MAILALSLLAVGFVAILYAALRERPLDEQAMRLLRPLQALILAALAALLPSFFDFQSFFLSGGWVRLGGGFVVFVLVLLVDPARRIQKGRKRVAAAPAEVTLLSTRGKVSLGVLTGGAVVFAITQMGPRGRWTCRTVEALPPAPPEASRCPSQEGFDRMQSFVLRLRRDGDTDVVPLLVAKARDRERMAVAVDSDRGGDCAGEGPDLPHWGESTLALSPACGEDATFLVNLHLCRVSSGPLGSAPQLDAAKVLEQAARLTVHEGSNSRELHCD